MAKCYNCEYYMCPHKYGEPLEGECPEYVPHYIDEEVVFEETKKKTKKEAH